MLDDAAAEDPVVVREAAPASGIGVYLRGAERSWHGGLATENTGADFAGDNLPPPADRGTVLRPEEFRWFTRDTADVAGPVSRWADISATATGQWASQTAPQRPDGTPIRCRMLFANTRGRIRLGPRDQRDGLYSGSRLDLSSGGWPAGMEAILASRMMPFLVDTTVRGSPEGGNRAQYVLDWNLRTSREVRLPFGRVEIAADLLNVLDNGDKIVESDLSGPLFNQRPALALPPPRTLRLSLRWHFGTSHF